MKKSYLIILFLLFFSGVLNIQAQQPRYGGFLVDTLASASFFGRGYVNGGDRLAAVFIEGQFKELGLEPAGKRYQQNFKVNVNTFPGNVDIVINSKQLKPGDNYLVEAYSPSLQGDFSSVYITFNELTNLPALKNKLATVAGKVVIIDKTLDDKVSSDVQKQCDELLRYIQFGKDLPHVATLILSDNKLTWSPAGFVSVRPVVTIKKDTSFEYKSSKVAIDIDSKFQKNYKTQNVSALIRGTQESDTFVVLSAHYDHLGLMGEENIFPGANDNASGVALMLDIAKYFSAHPPKYSLLFIALGAEELGLLGAKYYSDNPDVDLNKIKFLLNFDLAGTGDEGVKVVNATVFKEQFQRLQEINSSNNYLPAIKSRGEACISDHCMFYTKGVPSFYLYTLGGISAYHDVYDRPETLPLTEFDDYSALMIKFIEGF